MTKTIALGLMLIAAAFTVRGYTQQAQANEDWRQRECRYQSLDKGTWTAREERLTASCVVSRWSVPGGLAHFVAIGQCESGWNRFASNAGRYLGVFQHAASYWPSRVNHAMPDGWKVGPWQRWTNSRSQIVTTARMVHGARNWSAWSCA